MRAKTMPAIAVNLVLALCLALSGVWAVFPSAAQAADAPQLADAGQRTYIEFILDSSVSMTAKVEGFRSRMDVAKEVMEQLIRDLPDDPSLFIALRVYGAELAPNAADKPCDDTVLVQEFQPVASARKGMIDIVRSIKPKSMTPIAYSLELAAKDFPEPRDARNVIILVTDGAESCGGDPCVVSKRLQDQGLILKPYVVGFALSAKEAPKVMCIGDYYGATDTQSLKKALNSIMAQAISPSIIEVQSWAGGVNVTSRTDIQVIKPSGEAVAAGVTVSVPSAARVSLEEGAYTVRGRLAVGTEIITVEQAGVVAKPGQTTKVRLDFGTLEGRVRIAASASGMDVSGEVDIRVLKDGAPVAASWAGIPPSAPLPAGDYTFVVTHRRYPELSRIVAGSILPNRETFLSVDLGQLPAALEVRVTYMGASIAQLCQVTVSGSTVQTQRMPGPDGSDAFRLTTKPGSYDLTVLYQGEVTVEKAVRGVGVAGGETKQVNVDLGDVLGALRVRVMAAGRDVTSQARVVASGAAGQIELPLKLGVREVAVIPGVYGAEAVYVDGYPSDVQEAYVKAGQVTEVVIEVETPGRIVLIPLVAGKPLAPAKVSAMAFQSGAAMGAFKVQPDRLEIWLREGTYDVVGEVHDPVGQKRQAQGIVVKSGATTEVKMDFDPTGLLQVSVVLDGKPYGNANVGIYQGGDFVAWLERVDSVKSGVYQLRIGEGIYDIKIDPRMDGISEKIIRDVQLTGGATTEQRVDLGGAGTIRVTLTLDGKPYGNANVSIYQGGDFVAWLERVDSAKSGVYQLRIGEGIYDIKIDPCMDGISEKIIRDVQITGGATTEKQIDLGATGLLRVKLITAGKAFTEADVYVYQDSDYVTTLDSKARGVWEGKLPEGVYEVRIESRADGIRSKTVNDIEVRGGGTTEKQVDLGAGLSATVRVIVTLDGKPFSNVVVNVISSGEWLMELPHIGQGRFEGRLEPDVYSFEIHPDDYGTYDSAFLDDIDITEGAPVELRVQIKKY
ncbi:MAG: VWA domain-containing protein [Clostridia bacterium]|nr:VWA domain-containing protein [Clostridia bacterium]